MFWGERPLEIVCSGYTVVLGIPGGAYQPLVHRLAQTIFPPIAYYEAIRASLHCDYFPRKTLCFRQSPCSDGAEHSRQGALFGRLFEYFRLSGRVAAVQLAHSASMHFTDRHVD